MSIVYMNPGFVHLFQGDTFPYFEGTKEKYTKCQQYFVPLDHKNWHTVYTNEKIFDWYIRFDIYTNLANKPTDKKEGFFRLITYDKDETKIKDVTVSVDSRDNLVLSSGEETLLKTPLQLEKLHCFELHVKSNEKSETIELWHGEERIYTNGMTIYQRLDGKQPVTIQIKNIVYLPTKETYRFGIALSDFIIGNTRLGNCYCQILDTDVKSTFNKKSDGTYETEMYNKFINQTLSNLDQIKDVKDMKSLVLALSISAVDAITPFYKNNFLKYWVDDTGINLQDLPEIKEKGVQSEVLETDPVEGGFWMYDTLQRTYKMMSGEWEWS